MPMHNIRSKLIIAAVLLSGVPITTEAGLLSLKNRTFTPGEHIESPMKPQPMLTCLMNNARFFMGAVEGPARQIEERAPSFLDDFEFLSERRYDNRLGKTSTFFDQELDTRIYHSVTARPRPDGSIPVVDPESKGLFIYLHGSGTTKGSGANFAYKCTELSRLGFSCMSFDLPFHMDGSQSMKNVTTEGFHKMLHRMIEKYKVDGVPVYLTGHSFGPELVFEHAKRYPQDIDGLVALSPAAFTPELETWFRKVTSQATGFWGDTRPNDLGGIAGGQMTAMSEWNKAGSKLPDPTEVNPKLKAVILTGGDEEYVPGPLLPNGEPGKGPRTYDVCAELRKFMKDIVCTLEPGVGHYIFTHKDEYGNDAVMRELLRVTLPKEDMAGFGAGMKDYSKALKAQADARKLSEAEVIAQRYAREPFFRQWVDKYHGGIGTVQKLLQSGNPADAQELTRLYKATMDRRMTAIYSNILETRRLDPAFYSENRALIEQAFPDGKPVPQGSVDAIVAKYFDRLGETDPEYRANTFFVQPTVYNLPKEILDARVVAKPKPPKPAAAAAAPTAARVVEPAAKAPGLEAAAAAAVEAPPSPEEINGALARIQELRSAKDFRGAHALQDSLKRWADVKVKKGKPGEAAEVSWEYTAEARAARDALANAPAPVVAPAAQVAEATARLPADEVERTLAEVERLRGEKKFRESEALKASLAEQGIDVNYKKGKFSWSYRTE